jgi:hypothetical protein
MEVSLNPAHDRTENPSDIRDITMIVRRVITIVKAGIMYPHGVGG